MNIIPDFVAALHTNQRLLVIELLRRGVEVEPVELDIELLAACYRGHRELLFDRDSAIVPASLCEMARNKALSACLLSRAGLAVVSGRDFPWSEIDAALAFAEKLGYPVVVKPNIGSHGDGVFMNLAGAEQAERAIRKVGRMRSFQGTFLVEEQFNAPEYRVFVTRERNFAVLHRDPAHVLGDGFSSIGDLIERENYRRMNPRTTCLTPIVIDEAAEDHLYAAGRALDDVPLPREKVYLRASSNLAKGGTCEDFTSRAHSSVIEIAALALASFPGLPYAGIDLLSANIAAPQDENSYCIIEVNPSPGLHMHMRPALGAPQNVASYLADLIFPETRA
jgi:cyanophycin synthetase